MTKTYVNLIPVGIFTGYRTATNSNVESVDILHDSVLSCRSICHDSNMSIDSSTTPKPSIGITDDEPHNPMNAVVPNDVQQPKECFQNTEVDLKTSCGSVVYGSFSQTPWVQVPQLPVFCFSPFSHSRLNST